VRACVAMFHAQLRRFPHVTHAFNLSEEQLRAGILVAWRAGRPVELGDRRWVPDQTRLRILEGPELAPNELAMGRGWASAQRRATDVTERMLEGAAVPPPASAGDRALATELLSRAAAAPLTLQEAWHLVHERRPLWAASECLAAAERAVGLLVADDLAGVDPPAPQVPREPASWGVPGTALQITPAGLAAMSRARGAS
jgi:hypothetical protein